MPSEGSPSAEENCLWTELWPDGDSDEGTPNLLFTPSRQHGEIATSTPASHQIRRAADESFGYTASLSTEPDHAHPTSYTLDTFDLSKHLAEAELRGLLGSPLIDASFPRDIDEEELPSFDVGPDEWPLDSDKIEASSERDIHYGIPATEPLNGSDQRASPTDSSSTSNSPTNEEVFATARAKIVGLEFGLEEYRLLLKGASADEARREVCRAI